MKQPSKAGPGFDDDGFRLLPTKSKPNEEGQVKRAADDRHQE